MWVVSRGEVDFSFYSLLMSHFVKLALCVIEVAILMALVGHLGGLVDAFARRHVRHGLSFDASIAFEVEYGWRLCRFLGFHCADVP